MFPVLTGASGAQQLEPLMQQLQQQHPQQSKTANSNLVRATAAPAGVKNPVEMSLYDQRHAVSTSMLSAALVGYLYWRSLFHLLVPNRGHANPAGIKATRTQPVRGSIPDPHH
jgi:type VI protein secretion system component VasF